MTSPCLYWVLPKGSFWTTNVLSLHQFHESPKCGGPDSSCQKWCVTMEKSHSYPLSLLKLWSGVRPDILLFCLFVCLWPVGFYLIFGHYFGVESLQQWTGLTWGNTSFLNNWKCQEELHSSRRSILDTFLFSQLPTRSFRTLLETHLCSDFLWHFDTREAALYHSLSYSWAF